MLASRHIKREKASLPVDVRGSKTSLLKLPNVFFSNVFVLLAFRVEELMLNLDESSEALHRNLKEKEKENRNLERRYRNEKSD